MPLRLVAFVLSLLLLSAGWLPHALAQPISEPVSVSVSGACPADEALVAEASGALPDAPLDGSVSLSDAVESAVLPSLHGFRPCGFSMPRANGAGMADLRSTRADGLLRPPCRHVFSA